MTTLFHDLPFRTGNFKLNMATLNGTPSWKLVPEILITLIQQVAKDFIVHA